MKLNDAIAALSETSAALKNCLAGLTDTQLHFQPDGRYFSILENICHLRDIEIEGYGVRLQCMLAEAHPTLPDINGGQLALKRHYSEQALQPALDDFIRARETNLKVLENVTDAQLTRTGYLETTGEIKLGRLLELWAEHDQGHVRELDKLRSAAGGTRKAHKSGTSPSPGRP